MTRIERCVAAAMALTFSMAASNVSAQVASAEVGETLLYQQTGPNTVVIGNGGASADLYAFAFTQNSGDFDGGTLTFPGAAFPKSFNVVQPQVVGFQSVQYTQAGLNAAFPNNVTYTLNATDSTGQMSPQSVDVPYATDFASTIPALTAASYTALQAANPNATTTLNFNSFNPDPSATFSATFFTLLDLSKNDTTVDTANLAPSATSLSFGPGTLTTGDQYAYEFTFFNQVDGDSAGVTTLASSGVLTYGEFTVPAGVPEPSTWTFLLMGMAGLGFSIRRRRDSVVSAH